MAELGTSGTTGGAMARLRRLFVGLLVLCLAGATLYLLAERNSRFYFLSTRDGALVVARGLRLPWGKQLWQPTEPGLAAAYGAIVPPAGAAPIPERRFAEREELDRALFEILAGWAEPRIRTDDPAQVREGMEYVARASLLRGIDAEQQQRLRVLQGELAWYEGRDRLERGAHLLEEARAQLRLASTASKGRSLDAVTVLSELEPALEQLTRALRTLRSGKPLSASSPPVQAPAELPALPVPAPASASAGPGGAEGTAGPGRSPELPTGGGGREAP